MKIFEAPAIAGKYYFSAREYFGKFQLIVPGYNTLTVGCAGYHDLLRAVTNVPIFLSYYGVLENQAYDLSSAPILSFADGIVKENQAMALNFDFDTTGGSQSIYNWASHDEIKPATGFYYYRASQTLGNQEYILEGAEKMCLNSADTVWQAFLEYHDGKVVQIGYRELRAYSASHGGAPMTVITSGPMAYDLAGVKRVRFKSTNNINIAWREFASFDKQPVSRLFPSKKGYA